MDDNRTTDTEPQEVRPPRTGAEAQRARDPPADGQEERDESLEQFARELRRLGGSEASVAGAMALVKALTTELAKAEAKILEVQECVEHMRRVSGEQL